MRELKEGSVALVLGILFTVAVWGIGVATAPAQPPSMPPPRGENPYTPVVDYVWLVADMTQADRVTLRVPTGQAYLFLTEKLRVSVLLPDGTVRTYTWKQIVGAVTAAETEPGKKE